LWSYPVEINLTEGSKVSMFDIEIKFSRLKISTQSSALSAENVRIVDIEIIP